MCGGVTAASSKMIRSQGFTPQPPKKPAVTPRLPAYMETSIERAPSVDRDQTINPMCLELADAGAAALPEVVHSVQALTHRLAVA